MTERSATIAITRSMIELLKLYVPKHGHLQKLLFTGGSNKTLLRFSTAAHQPSEGGEAARELRTTIRAVLARPGLSEKTCERLRLDLNAVDEFLDTPVVDRVAGLA